MKDELRGKNERQLAKMSTKALVVMNKEKISEESIDEIELENAADTESKIKIASFRKTVAMFEKKVIEVCSNSEKSNNTSAKSKKNLRNLRKKNSKKENT